VYIGKHIYKGDLFMIGEDEIKLLKLIYSKEKCTAEEVAQAIDICNDILAEIHKHITK
jgi:hypothetical protein